MMEKIFLRKIHDMIKKAGRIALNVQSNSQARLKADNSVITEADMSISRLVRRELDGLLQTRQHILVEEEDPGKNTYLDQSLLEKSRYVWAIDPIDGTRSYANDIPQFGVSIGVVRDLKPWLGAVYFPALKEYFYCDGKNAYFVRDAFSLKEKRIRIKPIDQEISSQSVFLCHDAFFRKFSWDYLDCHVMIQACAVADICWPAVGRACGSIVRSSLWDFAGSWPIALKAGLDFRSLDSGKIFDRVHIDFFAKEKNSWKLKDYYILSSERNFPILKNKITPK